MTTTLQYEIPAWFQATPLRHQTPKMVCGRFVETFEVEEVEDERVLPVLDIARSHGTARFFMIDGAFYQRLGKLDGEDVKERYSAKNTPLPAFKDLAADFRNLRERARDEGLAIFPKVGSQDELTKNILSRDWFSDGDRMWLDRQRQQALAQLAELRCHDGYLFVPVPEPVYVVTITIYMNGDADVSMMTTSFNSEHAYLGWPVGYFRADERAEADAFLADLALRHNARTQSTSPRDVVLHDGDILAFDPMSHSVLEAATHCNWMVREVLMSVKSEDAGLKPEAKRIMEAFEGIFDFGDVSWREIVASPDKTDLAGRLEPLVREAMAFMDGYGDFPTAAFEALMSRWDERPVHLADTGPAPTMR